MLSGRDQRRGSRATEASAGSTQQRTAATETGAAAGRGPIGWNGGKQVTTVDVSLPI